MPPALGLRSSFRALSIRTLPILQTPLQTSTFAQTRRGLATDNNSTPPPNIPGQDGMPIPESFTNAGTEEAGAASAAEVSQKKDSPLNQLALDQLQMVAYGLNPFNPVEVGHKYGLPDLPIPSKMHMKHRYDPVIVQMTKLLMRDGKLSKAQRDMAMILNYLRTSPTPKLNPARPLLPGAPSPEALPLDPVTYIICAVDSVAPLIRLRSHAGMAGGGKSLDVPFPLALRQRRRTAFQWILDAVEKKKSKGSGRGMFPNRVAEEIVGIVEGRSTVWDKRNLVHRLGTTNRANVAALEQKTRKR